MAHYAWIDSNNIVINVTVGVDENVTHDNNGTPVGGSTEAWEQFYTQAVNQEGVYIKRTSYNNLIRKQFAAIGDTFDVANNIFIRSQPFPSWSLNENFDWKPPILYPMDKQGEYRWMESEQNWVR